MNPRKLIGLGLVGGLMAGLSGCSDGSGAPPGSGGTISASAGASSGGSVSAGDGGSAGGSAAGAGGTAVAEKPDGCALLVPGPGARALVADTSELFGPEFTVELWVKLDDVPDDLQAERQGFLMAENVDTDTGFYVEWGFGELSCVIREASVWYAAGFPIGPTSSGEFRHVACVRSEPGLSLWVDGLWMATSPDAIVYVHDGTPLVIGAGTALGSVPQPESAFAGAVDEIRFDSAARYSIVFEETTFTADEFVPEPRGALTATTRALWHFDECAGATAADESPNARTATLEGSATWLVP